MGQHSPPVMSCNTNSNTKARALTYTLQLAQLTERSLQPTIALVDFMKVLNIIPDGYIGHSVGELGCAYIDGCLTAEETILAAYYRGLASKEAELIPGYMAAIGLGYNDIKSMCPPEIDVACHNSFNSSTISGPEKIVKQFVQELKEKNIFARAVNVANIAYHSRYIKPAAPKLLEYLQQIFEYLIAPNFMLLGSTLQELKNVTFLRASVVCSNIVCICMEP
uniref:Malonyl-CoA:ACP transacylase (MAT) domain-containing protein n=1 Tax=Timema poppense TaxID=170557 RepID=A0A7R9DMX9_TIMPO|nr:unnamed protein product [Timema poppensis]